MAKSLEQFNPEDQESQPEQKVEGGNRPTGAGSVPEWSLWQPKVVRGKDGQQRESSVKSPDGKTYEMKDGEQFVVEKRENGDYEAAIVGADGEKTILRESLASKKTKHEQQDKEEMDKLRKGFGLEKEDSQETAEAKQEEQPYDRERLVEITKKCAKKGALFGKDVNLDDEDKRQIEIVSNLVEEQINEAMKNDEEWKNFKKLENELTSKGIMTTDASYVDGGENAHVQQREGDKSKGESPIQIVVPSRVYNSRFYRNVVSGTRDNYLKPSAEAIRGQSVKGLRDSLSSLSYFIRATEGKK
ncbi:MAG: hypothetical protein Q8Q48_02190 [Candidatus Staskawiczbacteria bacterium]|nr:hypothetical protein [Candidatus Staskawiczbacteria bacterium]